MRVARSLEALSSSPEGLPRAACVAIGNFDGVHLGHQALVASARSTARTLGGAAGVLTFSPHPQEVLRPDIRERRLTTDAEKTALLDGLGLDWLVVLPFNERLASLSAEQFFGRYLGEGLRAASVHVGHDFRFGKNRSGDAVELRALGKAAKIQVHVIDPVLGGGQRISSSGIRALISEGRVAQAAQSLGRPYRLSGPVVRGAGRGRGLGIPTANVDYPAEKLQPRHGVYATRVRWKGQSFRSVANFGVRPTFDSRGGRPILEVHILDLNENLYDQAIEVDLLDWIREERKFSGLDDLRAQIQEDIHAVREMKIVSVPPSLA